MPPDPPKPRPRQPSRPDLLPHAIAGDEQPERAAVRHHPGLDGQPQQPPKRTTLTDLPKVSPPERKPTLSGLPAPPALPLEHQPTVKAPANPLEKKTWRLPTPPSALANARRTDPPAAPEPLPTSIRMPANETTGAGLQSAQESLLRDELARERAKSARLERDARATAEARIQSYPPRVERSQSPVPSSAPSKTDAAIGKVVRTTATRLAERYGLMPLLLVFGIGGGVVAVAKPAAEPAKVTAIEARVTTLEQAQQLDAEQRNKAIQREAQRDAYLQCMLEEMSDGMAQLLPASDRVGNAAPMKPWVERCSRLKP